MGEIEQVNDGQAGSDRDNGSEAEEEEERGAELDGDSEAESSVDDEIEGFDVKPEDKEFFKELLHAAPPEAVIELTGKSRRASSSSSSSDTSPITKRLKGTKVFTKVESLAELAPDVHRSKRVKLFAEDHMFRSKDKWTEEELEEYEDDVYVFARAAGFSNAQAGLEVGKAVGVWKTERGLTMSSQLLTTAGSDKASAGIGKLSEEAKKKRKKEKKARQKQKRLERARSSRATSTANSETRHQDLQNLQSTGHPKLQNSQSHYVAEAVTAPKTFTKDDKVLSAADEKSVGLALKRKLEKKAEKKKRRKMAKLGPKKSEYFSGPVPATTSKSKDVGAPMSRQDGKRQIKEAKRLLAEKKLDEDGIDAIRIKQLAREAKQAVEKAPVLVKETPAKKKKQKISVSTTAEPELAGKEKKTRKHNKNRNKNRLPEEEHVITYTSIDTDVGKANQSMSKKREHDGSPKSNVAQESGHERKTVLSSFKNLLTEHGASSSSPKTMPQSAQGSADETQRPSKRRDRGEQKSDAKNEDFEMPEAGEGTIAMHAIPASDSVFELIETGETSSRRKRKRRKARAIEANDESSELGGTAKSSALAELTNSQKLHDDRPHNSKRRALSADAMESDRRPSAQSSKVHHSQ